MSEKKEYTEVGGDFNSPFIRNYIFSKAFFRYPEALDLPEVKLFTYNEHKTLTYFTDLDSWIACHEALRARVEKEYTYLETLINDTLAFGEEARAWAQNTFTHEAVVSATNQQLCDWYDQFVEKQSWLYLHGVTLPILDFQNFSFVESKLTLFLESIHDEKDRAMSFETFTQPAYPSFAQEQEEALLALSARWIEKAGWRDAVLNSSFAEVQVRFPIFVEELETHTSLFSWVYYAYAGPAYGTRDFFSLLKSDVEAGVDPKEKLALYQRRRNEIKENKKYFVEKYAKTPEHIWVTRMAGIMVWGKPRRKDYQSAVYASIEHVQKEIGRRLHLSLTQVRSMTPAMIRTSLVGGESVHVDLINAISTNHLCLPDGDGGIDVMVGTEAQSFFDAFHKQHEIQTDVNELVGMCAFKGQASGRVTIVNSVDDVGKMNHGDILVSLATTPSIVPAMKKASAIVTDEGGLTCHAAIVSRELGIPCIIGTKIATKVLKDGDMVEVDAGKGIVRKI